MGKITMGPQTLIYPMPALLVGANVDGKPNFMVVAWSGIANGEPPMISVAIRHHRYTFEGIRQNMTFSVNVPSTDMVMETDYCGIISGSKANKAEVCQFRVFYGKLGSAPLIEQCPVNLECKVVHILDLGSHSLVVGRRFAGALLRPHGPALGPMKEMGAPVGDVFEAAMRAGHELVRDGKISKETLAIVSRELLPRETYIGGKL